MPQLNGIVLNLYGNQCVHSAKFTAHLLKMAPLRERGVD